MFAMQGRERLFPGQAHKHCLPDLAQPLRSQIAMLHCKHGCASDSRLHRDLDLSSVTQCSLASLKSQFPIRHEVQSGGDARTKISKSNSGIARSSFVQSHDNLLSRETPHRILR